MKILFLSAFIISQILWAKSPTQPELYTCPYGSIEKNDSKPILLHVTEAGLVIGVCGFREKDPHELIEFTVHTFTNTQKSSKPIFSNSGSDKTFLAVESSKGLTLIEKVKVKDQYVELFKHDIICNAKDCKANKEVCLVYDKARQNKIIAGFKNNRLKSRMKAAGCFKK